MVSSYCLMVVVQSSIYIRQRTGDIVFDGSQLHLVGVAFHIITVVQVISCSHVHRTNILRMNNLRVEK